MVLGMKEYLKQSFFEVGCLKEIEDDLRVEITAFNQHAIMSMCCRHEKIMPIDFTTYIDMLF